MRTDTPQAMKLADYRPYPFAVETVRLEFDLHPTETKVRTRMQVSRKDGGGNEPMVLDGEGLTLDAIRIDGQPVADNAMTKGEDTLTLHDVPDSFVLETDVTIAPEKNTALSGLYMSGGRYCTQCEAEGFRRITYWPDRPDVMSRYSVRITAPKEGFPILLSNGSPGEAADLPDARHYAEWDDPHPKPSYLFALCAGDYDVYRDSFTTMGGRKVDLGVHVDKGDAERAAYAMDSLKRAMKWDEDVFGREYDLDVFNIVAVRDFNFGAMENKGLNIFNASYVLADAETATDADFEAIESIVGHEYFHNWTGNRITCRDWFQLCLKEGLTVFRDQEFSSDMRSRPVQRIKDVIRLRARQFPEDAGPLAHPVRPSEVGSIDNLYTATVYEKGSELIRMLRQLIGAKAFAGGMQLYFERFDGTAATIENFYACFAEAAGRDLSHFMVWYSQPGTPHVGYALKADANGAFTHTLTLTQTPGRGTGEPLPVPLDFAILDADTGAQVFHSCALPEADRVLDSAEVHIPLTLPDTLENPLVSFNRGFAAPIRIVTETSQADRIRLVEIETDPFNQWDGAQSLVREAVLAIADSGDAESTPDSALISSVISAARARRDSDPALASLLLRTPTVSELFMEREPADPAALDAARTAVRKALAAEFAADARAILAEPEPAPFRPDAEQAGTRALRGSSMALLAQTGDPADVALLKALFDGATSMTESLAALSALVETRSEAAKAALTSFAQRWETRPIVMDKWFSVQAMAGGPDAVERVEALTRHKAFDLRNPNRVRSVLAAFAMNNPAAFHRKDGAGHRLLAGMAASIDPLNPALAARLLTAFEQWKRLEPQARASARTALEGLAKAKLSRNAADIVSRALG